MRIISNKPTRLIVNADDFGLSPAVNAGIVAAHRGGILTSASLMANAPACGEAAGLARDNPRLGVGVHLNIVRGQPISPPAAVPSLIDAAGRFRRFRWRRLTAGFLGEAELEYRAQIEKILALGILPTHIDFEKHHAWQRDLYRLACRLAGEYGIGAVRSLSEPVWWSLCAMGWPGWGRCVMASALRCGVSAYAKSDNVATPDRLLGQLHIGKMNEATWLRLLRRPPPGVSEVMTHPGCAEPLAAAASPMGGGHLAAARPVELAALVSERVRERVVASGIELTTYAALRSS